MQVKWYYRSWRRGGRHLYAKLASNSYRKPGARTPTWDSLGFLASIKEQDISSPAARYRFWETARAKLAQIANLSQEDHEKSIASLAKRIPEPTIQQLAEVQPSSKKNLPAQTTKTVKEVADSSVRWGKRVAKSKARDYDEAEQRLSLLQFAYVYLQCKPSIPRQVRFKAIDEARWKSSQEMMEEIEQMLGEAAVED